jgi:multicomponent Na+:H+ antiporter subunit B
VTTSLILSTAARLIAPMLLLFSLFLLVRGHNEPGGGFAGGLVASAGYTLVAIAVDAATARRMLVVEPPVIAGSGLAVALAAGLIGLMMGQPLLTGIWLEIMLPGEVILDLGTPLLFDLGVFLVVIGATMGIILGLIEQQADSPAGLDG